jgi:hypothetical protein
MMVIRPGVATIYLTPWSASTDIAALIARIAALEAIIAAGGTGGTGGGTTTQAGLLNPDGTGALNPDGTGALAPTGS